MPRFHHAIALGFRACFGHERCARVSVCRAHRTPRLPARPSSLSTDASSLLTIPPAPLPSPNQFCRSVQRSRPQTRWSSTATRPSRSPSSTAWRSTCLRTPGPACATTTRRHRHCRRHHCCQLHQCVSLGRDVHHICLSAADEEAHFFDFMAQASSVTYTPSPHSSIKRRTPLMLLLDGGVVLSRCFSACAGAETTLTCCSASSSH